MRKNAKLGVDAMLRHLASHHDPRDFPSTAYERQDLIEAAGKRRLIEWHKERRRYELTSAGWRRLRHGRLGLPAWAIAAGIGAAAGAAALAVLWLPTGRPAGDRAASGAPVENARAAAPATPAAPAVTPAAVAPAAVPTAAPSDPAEPATGAEEPVPAQPSGEPTTTAAKEPAAKKPRHGTRAAGRRNWNFGRYRDERFAGSGGR
jgi:hypothetical protein